MEKTKIVTKRKVMRPFNARRVNSRASEKFSAGELLVLVDAPELSADAMFSRLTGLRPNRGAECRYILDSIELDSKTEAAR